MNWKKADSISWAAAGLGSYVEALVRKHDVEFNVGFPDPIYSFRQIAKCMSASMSDNT